MISVGEIILRLGVAGLLGVLVGAERERVTRSAGMRTMGLVGLGAALFTVVAIYPFTSVLAGQRGGVEPSRIIAQIVTGIGFLGAGTIWLRKDMVRGLTTAAALWVVAAVGMACGAGQWTVAIAAVIVLIVVLAGLRPLERRLFPVHGRRTLRIWVDSGAAGDVIVQAQRIGKQAGLLVDALTLSAGEHGGDVVELHVRASDAAQITRAITETRQLPGVTAVRGDLGNMRVPAPTQQPD